MPVGNHSAHYDRYECNSILEARTIVDWLSMTMDEEKASYENDDRDWQGDQAYYETDDCLLTTPTIRSNPNVKGVSPLQLCCPNGSANRNTSSAIREAMHRTIQPAENNAESVDD
jgi:hypothetical protein